MCLLPWPSSFVKSYLKYQMLSFSFYMHSSLFQNEWNTLQLFVSSSLCSSNSRRMWINLWILIWALVRPSIFVFLKAFTYCQFWVLYLSLLCFVTWLMHEILFTIFACELTLFPMKVNYLLLRYVSIFFSLIYFHQYMCYVLNNF